MHKLLAPIFAIFLFATSVVAQANAPIDTLIRALGLYDVIEIMREEGVSYGENMQQDFLEGRGGDRWPAEVARIYEGDRLTEIVRIRLDTELAAEDLAPMLAFFESDLGKRIITLEVSARRAFLDEEIEEASKDVVTAMRAEKNPRLDLIQDLTSAGDLIDNNVVGALNSNYAFYQGLAQGGALPTGMTEDEILADVWGQEPDIRNDTTEWLYSYLTMAYQPLSDEELAQYIAFFKTPHGQALNDAIFKAFDEMFVVVSGDLGAAAANFMAGEEL